jgi:NADPH:quinone reductase-like Zn-dependent oxidoreductase
MSNVAELASFIPGPAARLPQLGRHNRLAAQEGIDVVPTRQVWVTRSGPPDALQTRSAELRPPAPGEARIAVSHAGVNFADIAARVGAYPGAPRPPFVPGFELSGTIAELGELLAGARPAWQQPGAAVVAFTRYGGYADHSNVPVDQLFPLPAGFSMQTAAALPIAYLTAYQALVVMGSVRPGSRVLIVGAGGGLGLAAVEICRVMQATVLAAASSHKHQHLIDQGVRHVIDYRVADLATAVATITNGEGVDLVLEPRGAGAWSSSYALLAPSGRLVIVGNAAAVPDLRPRPLATLIANLRFAVAGFSGLRLVQDNRAVVGVHLGKMWGAASRVRQWLEILLGWVEAGKLQPHVDKIFPLDRAADAHTYIQSRRNIGKVLLRAAGADDT